ncbi:hypothetical protein SEA_QUADZERO_58 [Microbacterium phage QuadZero]|nr:hypothetical protein SEA_QUADZERO_58 [Microbacterium phage QuadZero]
MTESLGKAIERLQKAAHSWKGFRHAAARPKDITAVLNELERLRVESLNTVLREATREPAEGFRVANPGEFAAMWNLRDEEGRQVIVDRINGAMDTSIRCVQADHEHLQEELNSIKAKLSEATGRIKLVQKYANDRKAHARSQNNTLSSWRVWSDLCQILGTHPKDESWKVEYAHPDCAECEDCAEQAISYAKAAGTQSEQMVKSAFGGHAGSARRA